MTSLNKEEGRIIRISKIDLVGRKKNVLKDKKNYSVHSDVKKTRQIVNSGLIKKYNSLELT